MARANVRDRFRTIGDDIAFPVLDRRRRALDHRRLDDIASSQGIDSVRALRFSVFFAE
jgi:hypothetical protein